MIQQSTRSNLDQDNHGGGRSAGPYSVIEDGLSNGGLNRNLAAPTQDSERIGAGGQQSGINNRL